MKAILNYKNYFNQGKQYHLNFIYDNEFEAQKMTSHLKLFQAKKIIEPHYIKIKSKKNDNILNIINSTNIHKDILIPFISMLMTNNNVKIIIENEQFNSFNLEIIQQAIDNLHINATINKGNFFSLGDTYYITFKYSNEEQKDEISYYFNCKYNYDEIQDFLIIALDKFGKITNKNNGTIISTNIPKEKISIFIKDLIEKYDAIITIGNKKLKEHFDETTLLKALSTIDGEELGRSRTRKKQGIK